MVQGASLNPMLTWTGAALVLGSTALFIYSGLDKISALENTRSVLRAHQLLPARIIPTAAIVVGGWEVLSGAAAAWLLVGAQRPALALLTIGAVWFLLGLYAAGLSVHPPSAPAPCRCGLSTRVISDWRPIAARNLAFAGIAVSLASLIRRASLDSRRADAGSRPLTDGTPPPAARSPR